MVRQVPDCSGEALSPFLFFNLNSLGRYSFTAPVTASKLTLRLYRQMGMRAGAAFAKAKGVTATNPTAMVSRKRRLAADARKRGGAVTGVGRHHKSTIYRSSLAITQRDDASQNQIERKMKIKFFLASWIFNIRNTVAYCMDPPFKRIISPLKTSRATAAFQQWHRRAFGLTKLLANRHFPPFLFIKAMATASLVSEIFYFGPVVAQFSPSAACLCSGGFRRSFGPQEESNTYQLIGINGGIESWINLRMTSKT